MTILKRKISLLIGLLLVTIGTIHAQNFQGIATYQSSRNMSGMEIKAEGVTEAMQKQLMEQMKKQFQREYELQFNLTESSWKEEESLDGGPATASSGGMRISFSTAGGGITYKNTSENLYIQETTVFSKPFLVKDALEPYEWQMTDETKTIGNYTAYKAVYKDIRESRSISFTSDSDDKDKESSESKVNMDTISVTAWYTPEIPVSQGPADYWGLPGLILELGDGSTTYLCTKVVLNPEEEIKIKRPSKGKKVTREELRVEMDAKLEEMSKKFKQGGKGGATIRIGGDQ